MRRPSLWLAFLAGALFVAAGGCASGPKTIKVRGKVMLDGQPLPNASVVFVPANKDGGRSAVGTTGEDGVFTLSCFGASDGALPGDYKVTVTWREGQSEADAPEGEENPMKTRFLKWEKQTKEGASAKKKKPPKYNVPASYGNAEKTTLTAKVPGPEPVLELSSSGK